MDKINCFSPAKINLFLHILGRRPDGFHNLVSQLQTLSFGDRLLCSLAAEDALSCDDPRLSLNSDNLIIRAAQLFRKVTGLSLFFSVDLQKRIPMQSGLGGGSSNAATALWAFNQLAGSPLTEADLRHHSAQLGSDVPFFFSSGSALIRGRGEEVASLQPLKGQKVVLFLPPVACSTPKVFGVYKQLSQAVGENHLEEAALAAYPELLGYRESIIHALEGLTPSFSGSGSTYFSTKTPLYTPAKCQLVETAFATRAPAGWYSIQ